MSIQKMFRWGLGALGLLSLAALVVALIALGNYSGQTPGAQAQPTNTPTPAPTTTTSAAAPSSNPISVTVANPGPSRQISVYAVGQVQAPPDVAYLNVGVELQAPTASEAQDKVNAKAEQIRKAIVGAGIANENIQPTGIHTYPVTGAPGKDGVTPTEPTAYRAGINFNVTISDLSKASAALDAATKAGANQVGGLSYAIKDDSSLRAQALEQAVKQALPKAQAIARGLNLQLGQVVTVIEDPNGYYPGPGMGAGGKGDAIAPGQLTVAVRVTVVYAVL